MTMKNGLKLKTLIFLILSFLIFPLFGRTETSSNSLPLMKESDAYKEYLKRPQSELSKVLFLIDRFKNTEFKVIYGGDEYDSNFGVTMARQFLILNYKNETADRWVKTHTYLSEPEGQIIYLKYPKGDRRPARDVLLEELRDLDNLEALKGQNVQPFKGKKDGKV